MHKCTCNSLIWTSWRMILSFCKTSIFRSKFSDDLSTSWYELLTGKCNFGKVGRNFLRKSEDGDAVENCISRRRESVREVVGGIWKNELLIRKFWPQNWFWFLGRNFLIKSSILPMGHFRRKIENWCINLISLPQKNLTGNSIFDFWAEIFWWKVQLFLYFIFAAKLKVGVSTWFHFLRRIWPQNQFWLLGRNFLRNSSILPILHFRRKIQNLQISKFHHSLFPLLPIHFAHLPLSFGSLSTTLRLNNNISKIHSPRLFTLANTFALHYCILPAQKEVADCTPSQNAIFTNPSTTSLSCTHFVHIFTNSIHLSKLAETPSLH